MAETRRKYTKEFKLDALRLYENSGKSIREIEEDLGIGRGVMYRWKRGIVNIADTGSGIPGSIKDYIFEPVFTTKKHGEGIG